MWHNSIILTTSNSIEGYHIIEQLGVVYGDSVFKPDFLAMTSVRDRSTVHSMFFGSAEMERTEKLMDESREYARKKMIKSASELGANAIIGFISNSSMGNDLIHISLYGTAVKVISDVEYNKAIEADQEAKAQKQVEKDALEAEQKRQLEELRARHGNEDFKREEMLLKDIADVDSVMRLWELWCQSGLSEKYTEMTQKIKMQKDSERMYGKMPGEAKNLKKMISVAFFGE